MHSGETSEETWATKQVFLLHPYVHDGSSEHSYVGALEKQNLESGILVRPLDRPSSSLDGKPGFVARFKLEDLAPPLVLRQAIDDWFELVHPVAPLLHRDSFLRRLLDPSCAQDTDFLSLVVSVCAATVSTLRRRTAPYSGIITVEKCFQILSTIDSARGDLPISLIRCQAKYNLACSLTQERGMDDRTTQLLFAEVTSMVGILLHYEIDSASTMDRELTRRLHWLCFAGQWSVSSISSSIPSFIH